MQKSPAGSFVIGAVFTLVTASGCVSGGRQVSPSNTISANRPYGRRNDESVATVNWQETAQQTVDMAGVGPDEGTSGVYLSGSYGDDHYAVANGSMGIFKMPSSWSTVRTGVFGMDKNGKGIGGVEAGVRVHAPTRFTPYVGLSGDLGVSGLSPNHVQQTNSLSRGTTQRSRPIATLDGFAAVVPEAGVSYWLNSSTRLNAGASYYFYHTPNQPDFLVFGASLEFVTGGSNY